MKTLYTSKTLDVRWVNSPDYTDLVFIVYGTGVHKFCDLCRLCGIYIPDNRAGRGICHEYQGWYLYEIEDSAWIGVKSKEEAEQLIKLYKDILE